MKFHHVYVLAGIYLLLVVGGMLEMSRTVGWLVATGATCITVAGGVQVGLVFRRTPLSYSVNRKQPGVGRVLLLGSAYISWIGFNPHASHVVDDVAIIFLVAVFITVIWPHTPPGKRRPAANVLEKFMRAFSRPVMGGS